MIRSLGQVPPVGAIPLWRDKKCFKYLATKKSAFADLVNQIGSLNGWPDNLTVNVPQGSGFVKGISSDGIYVVGVDLPGVEPGRFGLSDQPSEPARPTSVSLSQFLTGLVNENASQAGILKQVQDDVATISATLTPDISSSLKEQMASVSGRLAQVENMSASSAAQLTLQGLPLQIGQGEAFINVATMSASFGNFSDSLKVIGATQLGNTTIGGSLSVGLLHFDDVTASISSLTGELTVEGDLKVTGKLKLPNSSGKITIAAGAKDLTIDVLGVSTSSAVFATPEDQPVPVSARSTESGKLTIQIPDALPVNLKVNWWFAN